MSFYDSEMKKLLRDLRNEIISWNVKENAINYSSFMGNDYNIRV